MTDTKVLETLAAWDRRFMFSGEWTTNDPRRANAVLTYMLRCLSRGRIPDPVLVTEVLYGAQEVPQCGYIGCTCDYEHVH